MKKIVYTLSFLAFSTFVVNAQTQVVSGHKGAEMQQEPTKTQEPKAQEATLQKGPSKKATDPADPTSVTPKKEASTSSSPAKTGTRMAINEKGVPASKETKNTSSEKVKEAKTEKAVNPGQPTTTENK